MLDVDLLKGLLAEALGGGRLAQLREVLGALTGEELNILAREVKDAVGLKMAGAPIVKFKSPLSRIDAIKVVREVTGLGLREAKDLVYAGRVPVTEFTRAQHLKDRLHALGIRDAEIIAE